MWLQLGDAVLLLLAYQELFLQQPATIADKHREVMHLQEWNSQVCHCATDSMLSAHVAQHSTVKLGCWQRRKCQHERGGTDCALLLINVAAAVILPVLLAWLLLLLTAKAVLMLIR
jgi:hypothetical protein